MIGQAQDVVEQYLECVDPNHITPSRTTQVNNLQETN
jgi:hypothetical protein